MRGEVQEGGDICIHIVDSLPCTETNNIVKQLYPSKKEINKNLNITTGSTCISFLQRMYYIKIYSLKVGIYFVNHLLKNLNTLAVYLLNWWTMGA